MSKPCTCAIQWIDLKTAKPTPDTNPAVGNARITFTNADGSKEVSEHPICAAHLERMPRVPSVAYDGGRFLYRSEWSFHPFAE